MMRILGAALILIVAATSWGQTQPERTVVRYKIMHGDPYLIVALIQGLEVTSPEISVLFNFAGVPTTIPDDALIPKGRIIVDPTDNSIIYMPFAP